MAFMLTILSLFTSWAAAFLLAAVATQLTFASGLINVPVLRLFKPQGKNAYIKGLQKILFILIWIELIRLLSRQLGIAESMYQAREFIIEAIQLRLTPELMSAMLNDAVLFLGLYVIYQVLLAVNKLFPYLEGRIENWGRTRLRVVRLKSMELFTPNQIIDSLRTLNRYVQIGLNLFLVTFGATYIFSFFPGTQQIAAGIINQVFDFVESLEAAASKFLPNLVTLILIFIFARYVLRLLRFFNEGIQAGKIKIIGLHKELAEPTYQLLRILTIALAVVAAYPYLPGSDSPVFRGITIFVGFLLSVGSTALVTNVVSGVVLTYTRGMRIGDRVKIGDTVGDVIERTLLVTRIRTIKNVVVSIPNSMVLNNEIINYSAPSVKESLILHTGVTIGYDVPWRQVHDLLIQAALATGNIQHAPKPFVLQTSLDDYYVSYELNAYTIDPKLMAGTYSDLHQNIQDGFNAASVEIMSPAYTALRADGPRAMVSIGSES